MERNVRSFKRTLEGMNLSKEEYKKQLLDHCNGVAFDKTYNCPKESTPENITAAILVGIHGRSEGYQYGGKSGYAFGTFLGEEKNNSMV